MDAAAQLSSMIARGDRRNAAALLVREHAAEVYALCRAMVRDRALAEDLAQDTFARAIAALAGYRAEASPRTWLLAIARNRCLDHLDHVRRAPWGRDPDPAPDDHPLDSAPPVELLARREDAERAMAVLGEAERALVVLHFGHGVGYPELADSFGIGQGAVRMRVSRALGRMRAALREDTFDESITGRMDAVDFDAEASGSIPTATERMAALDADADADDALRTLDESVSDVGESSFDDTAHDLALDPYAALREDVPDTLWARLQRLV